MDDVGELLSPTRVIWCLDYVRYSGIQGSCNAWIICLVEIIWLVGNDHDP